MNSAEKFFLSRYFSDPKRNLLKFSFVFMVLGIVLSVGILSAGLNLFEGYERALKDVLLDSYPHIQVQSTSAQYLDDTQVSAIRTAFASNRKVRSITPAISFNVMAVNGEQLRGCMFNAYDDAPGGEASYARFVKQGKFDLRDGEVIVGHYLAEDHGLAVGDTIRVLYPQLDRITPLGLFSGEHAFRVAGIYRSGYYESDRALVIGTLSDARSVLNISEGFASVEVKLKPEYVEQSIQLARQYDIALGKDYAVYPMLGTSLLRMVAMQKWLIFIVFSFLVLIAGINVISAVSTLILDKKNEIAVLKTLGALPRTIKGVIFYQILLVCLSAIVIGQLFGLLLSWLVVKQNFYHLKGEIYFIDRLELFVSPINMLAVFTVAALLVVLCIRVPLRRIDRMHIIDLLRNP